MQMKHIGFLADDNDRLDRLFDEWDALDHAAAHRSYENEVANERADIALIAYNQAKAEAERNVGKSKKRVVAVGRGTELQWVAELDDTDEPPYHQTADGWSW
jgi:hypothetical protein